MLPFHWDARARCVDSICRSSQGVAKDIDEVVTVSSLSRPAAIVNHGATKAEHMPVEILAMAPRTRTKARTARRGDSGHILPSMSPGIRPYRGELSLSIAAGNASLPSSTPFGLLSG